MVARPEPTAASAASRARSRRPPLLAASYNAGARVARRAFQNYGRMVLDFLLMGSLTKEELIKRTDVDGLEHLDAALARGRGVIMALPHMGSWDNTGSYGGALGYPIMAVTGRFPRSLNDAVVKTR